MRVKQNRVKQKSDSKLCEKCRAATEGATVSHKPWNQTFASPCHFSLLLEFDLTPVMNAFGPRTFWLSVVGGVLQFDPSTKSSLDHATMQLENEGGAKTDSSAA